MIFRKSDLNRNFKKIFGKNQLRSDMNIMRLVLTLMTAFVFVVGAVGCTTAPPTVQTAATVLWLPARQRVSNILDKP